MRRLIGFLMLVIGLAGVCWLGYNYFQIGGDFPAVYMIAAIALILLGGIVLFARRRQAPLQQMPTNVPPRI